MPYPQYTGLDKPNKGEENGACNRGLCQDEPAIWYNHGSRSWYCARCRRDIEFDAFNKRDWDRNWLPIKGHPMFETREMMKERENREADAIRELMCLLRSDQSTLETIKIAMKERGYTKDETQAAINAIAERS